MRSLLTPRLVALAAAGLGLLSLPASASAAEQLVGLTGDNQLLLFRSDSPGNLQGTATVTGLQQNEVLVGVAWSPQLSRLYALGSSNRLYVVNPVTGGAVPVATTPFSPPLNGESFGFAIDGSNSQARSYSSSNQNLRISIGNGQVAGVDQPYTYDPTDPGTGTTPVLAALAYSTPPTGGGVSGLYAIDTARDALVSSPTQAATIRTIGELGVAADGPAGLALTQAGAMFAALRTGGDENPRLYSVDLSTGAATPATTEESLATIAYRSSATAAGNTPIISMTALGEVPNDEARPRAVVGVSTNPKGSTLRSSGLPFSTSCNEACTVSGVLTVGKKKQTAVTGAVLATAGWVRLTAKLNSATKSALKSDATQGFSLKVTVTDAAGNTTNITTSGSTRD